MPTVEQVEQVVKSIIFRAKRDDRLGYVRFLYSCGRAETSIKSVRRQVEKELHMEEGECDRWKGEIKLAVNWALDNDEPEPGEEPAGEPSTSGTKGMKRKSEGGEKPAKKSRPSEDKDDGVRQPVKAGSSSEHLEGDEESGEQLLSPQKPSSKLTEDKEGEGKEPSAKKVDDSETDMSSVYDSPPAHKRSKAEKTAKPSGERRRRRKEAPPPSGSAEEDLARLKKFVTACGVRKQWNRELAGLSPSEQVRHVKRLLSELGMTGRLSLDKAKKIREKRELAQEIEDVVEFEKARGMSARRTRGAVAKQKVESASEAEKKKKEEAEDVVERKVGLQHSDGSVLMADGEQKKEQDLLAFIGDQSEED
ncbi:hypothetical protein DACRYDRAFT_105783 [Dacryopinax primogenitus]|uniref:Uncharacterized protein n=1 Tax=Dacryopinax primogenitus (strain DJM 731) TaxID=1858805 RepID=M5G5X8_DACPD|nr:uncharacterized protein DACRYDRAFT_105783 [Dacryopinax primogenitus]EJU03620.1 hypothetical protein DACRYDRAFT_105783 [Dacryopinax primogenitus]